SVDGDGQRTAIRSQLEALGEQRMDVRQAPMLRLIAANDAAAKRYLLSVSLHHLISDHTTLERMIQEISLIQQNQHEALPAVVPFRNFVAQSVLGADEASHRAFFTEMLGDVEEPTAPFGVLDIQGDGSAVEEVSQPLPAALSQAIRELARSQAVSAASVFHLAWALVLSVTSAQSRPVFGTVLFGRMQGGQGIDQAMGMFINTLPVCIDLEHQSVAQALQQTHQRLTALLSHEHASLSLAQQCSGVPAGVPLFTSMLNYRYMADETQESQREAWEGMQVVDGKERTNFPITMCVDDHGHDFALVSQVHVAVGAQRMVQYLHHALEHLVKLLQERDSSPLRAFSLLPPQETAQLADWGRAKAQYQVDEPIHALIEQQARNRPHDTAVLMDENSLTYEALNEQANRLAHYLIQHGVGRESRVGLAVERSLEMVVGLLAILKAGAAYVPLDPDYPSERLAYMMQDSGIRVLLTQEHLLTELPQDQAIAVILLGDAAITQQSSLNPGLPVHPESLAYLIYTSGSTGRPKGAQLSHANVVRLLSATQPWFDFGPQDVWTQFHSYAFDFSVWEIFGALCTGGKLVLVPYLTSRSPHDFLQLLQREKVTVLNQTPSAFGQLVALAQGTMPALALRKVIFGGEALEPKRLQPWMDVFGDAMPGLINMYGITETTVHVTYRPIVKQDLAQMGSPVGAAIPDLGLYVLDSELNRLPAGVAGELCVSGAGLSRGYLNQADLTSERFIADPFSERGERMYRTGDLARWTQAGQLEYLGRIDHQVKVRGFRIELGEIESQLLALEGVREAVVLAHGAGAETRLAAYISLKATYEFSPADLRQRLGEVLPDYMVPASVLILEALPLNANSKVDRRALPDPEFIASAVYEAPVGEVEEQLARIWSDLLSVERVGRHDNFFELGGHSLLAVQLVSRIQGLMKRQVEIKDVFLQPTVASLAQSWLQDGGDALSDQAIDDIERFIFGLVK
ncbi:amino acid adenylation domain-containing protein, partial [Alcaligenes faecalis]|uniref:non-ribosomal peptide synthetase n=1 Tax=Alcaligenes faecalis TaxID=511 RepID=UPI0029330C19